MTLRLPKAELPAELKENMIKQLGVVPENVEVLWHSPRVTQDNLEFGAKVGAWDEVDPGLKSFAHMAVASQVGCSWCRSWGGGPDWRSPAAPGLPDSGDAAIPHVPVMTDAT